METNRTASAEQLHKILSSISIETIKELTRRNLLHFGDDYWRFGDDSNGVRRKLNARQKWMRADNDGAAWHRLIGLNDVIQHDRRYVLLAIEGSKDALAAADFAYCRGLLGGTGVICALGSGYRAIPSELHKLAGRFVGVIGDNDVAGIETTQLVSYALNQAGIENEVWDWSKCENRAKDFFDFWVKAKGKAKTAFVRLYSGTLFCPSLPSHNSPVQQFNPSTQVPAPDITSVIGVTVEQFVAPYVVNRKGTE